jgi:hypothetical protein
MTTATATVTKAPKAVNYTPEQAKQIVDLYAGGKGKTKEELAAQFGKTVKSIVAKLVREKVYVKAEYQTKQGTKPVSKEQHVAAIATFLGVPADKLDSLEKANKGVLQMLEDFAAKTAKDFANETEVSGD